jgi:hypothetical protein
MYVFIKLSLTLSTVTYLEAGDCKQNMFINSITLNAISREKWLNVFSFGPYFRMPLVLREGCYAGGGRLRRNNEDSKKNSW